MRRFATVALLLVVIALPVARAQDLVIGGEAAVLPSLTLSPRLFELARPRLRTEFQTATRVYDDLAELHAAATVWHEAADVGSDELQSSGVLLDELRLRLMVSPWAAVEIGRFRHRIGRAFLRSPNDTYTSVSFDAVVRGDVDATGSAQTLATATAFLGPASLTAVVMPVPAVPQLVEPGSIWIPRLPLDEVIDDPRIFDEPVTLNEIFAEPTRAVEEPYWRVSGGVHAGVVLGPVDLLLYYYHGIDPAPVPRSRIDFPRAPIRSYDLYIAPEEVIINSFGLAAESVTGSTTFWVDAAFVPDKTISTNRIDPYSKRSRLETVPTVTAVAGASYRAGVVDLLLLGEYYFEHSFLPDDVALADVVVSPLSADLLLSANLRLGERSRWALALAGLASFDDGGAVISASATWEPMSGVTAALRVPVFLGPGDSDFGQYKDIVHIVSELRYSF